MNATRHIEPEDLALFAMQLADQREAAEISAHLECCADCLHALAEAQGDLAMYAFTVEMHSPPAQAGQRLLNQVAREKREVPRDRPATTEVRPRADGVQRAMTEVRGAATGSVDGTEPSFERELKLQHGLGRGVHLVEDEHPSRGLAARALPWVGWAMAAGLAIAAGNLYQQRDALRSIVATQSSTMGQLVADAASARQLFDAMTDPAAKRVSLTTTPQAKPVPQARATYVASKGTLIFQASNLEPLGVQKVYELWLIPADGQDPIAAGTFHPDEHGNASVILPELPKGVEAKAFGVTIEDAGGATKPTLPIILSGV